MKYFYLIFLDLICTVNISGQKSYIIKDSAISVGVKLIVGSEPENSKFCQAVIDNNRIRFSPYEVSEYGFENGHIYVSKDITFPNSYHTRLFLRQLQKGETSLYCFMGRGKNVYFIEKDSNQVVPLPRRDADNASYKEQLSDLTKDCPNISDCAQYVSYNKKSLAGFISRYNKCDPGPFPHFRFGITVGYESVKLISYLTPLDANYFDFSDDGGFNIGCFFDDPIYITDFSLNYGIQFSKHGYSENKTSEVNDLDFVTNFSALTIPVLVRYVYPSTIIRPFCAAGLVGSYNIESETHLYKSVIAGNVIKIEDSEEASLFDDFHLGLDAGIGIEVKITASSSVLMEVEYSRQFDIYDPRSIYISGMKLSTGIIF